MNGGARPLTERDFSCMDHRTCMEDSIYDNLIRANYITTPLGRPQVEYLINMGARLRTTSDYTALTYWRGAFDLNTEIALLRVAILSRKTMLARPVVGQLLSAEHESSVVRRSHGLIFRSWLVSSKGG